MESLQTYEIKRYKNACGILIPPKPPYKIYSGFSFVHKALRKNNFAIMEALVGNEQR